MVSFKLNYFCYKKNNGRSYNQDCFLRMKFFFYYNQIYWLFFFSNETIFVNKNKKGNRWFNYHYTSMFYENFMRLNFEYMRSFRYLKNLWEFIKSKSNDMQQLWRHDWERTKFLPFRTISRELTRTPQATKCFSFLSSLSPPLFPPAHNRIILLHTYGGRGRFFFFLLYFSFLFSYF